MPQVNKRCHKYRDNQLYTVISNTTGYVLVKRHFTTQVECDAQHYKRVKQLRNHRTARTAQPYHAFACHFFKEMKHGNVYNLRYDKRRNTAYDNELALPEYGVKLFVGNPAVALGGGYFHGKVQQHKTVGNKACGNHRQALYALAPKVFVNKVGSNKHHRPRHYPYTHKVRPEARHGTYKNKLGAYELGYHGIGNKYPCKDNVQGAFARFKHNSGK